MQHLPPVTVKSVLSFNDVSKIKKIVIKSKNFAQSNVDIRFDKYSHIIKFNGPFRSTITFLQFAPK